MLNEPPPFQEAASCDVCKCSFNTFRRRHHCRRCGRTLCHEHSSNQMALPQFGIYSSVRVCVDCFNDSSASRKGQQPYLDGVDPVADAVSRLNITANLESKTGPTAEDQHVLGTLNCNCGMPLCICVTPSPITESPPVPRNTTSTFTAQLNPKPRKTEINPKNRGSASNSKHGSSQVNQSTSDSSQMHYEPTGEGLREAIKSGDTYAVKKLLSEGVDANYQDKQGFSLLHLAAVFNQTDIVFALIDSGASLEYKNAQGETPLDCAPVTLQYKIRQKMEESKQ